MSIWFNRPILRLAVFVGALLLTSVFFGFIAWFFSSITPQPPAKVPFGLAREAIPTATGIGGYILALQGRFYKALTDSILILKENGATLWPLLGIGFFYGVFHAAGPGHGKGVISAYLVASERSLKKGLFICLAAALLQAFVAIVIVLIAAIVLNATARQMTAWSNTIEIGSFFIVACLGLLMTWRKAGKAAAVFAMIKGQPIDPQALACDHVHLPPPDAIDAMKRWRDRIAVVVAAGTRPCSGALIILIFALSQGVFAAGIAATLAMALGTAITTGIIASIAVFAKAFALRIAGGRRSSASITAVLFELAAAAFVAVLGIALVTGLWLETTGS